jgi:hypothetical protein
LQAHILIGTTITTTGGVMVEDATIGIFMIIVAMIMRSMYVLSVKINYRIVRIMVYTSVMEEKRRRKNLFTR